jgi:uncharacterized Rmd1/YagE family protein
MTNDPSTFAARKKARAILLGDRIDTSGLEHDDVLSTAPLAFRAGKDGVVTLFRYGVAVLFDLSVLEEDDVVRGLRARIIGPVAPREDETAIIQISPDKDEQILPGGPIQLRTITPEHMIVIADALAKSVVLARDEREVSSVIEVIEPLARQLAEEGRTPGGRRAILNTSARPCWCNIASPAASRWRKSPMWYGTAPISSDSLHGCRTSTSSRSAPRPCHASSP